MNTENKKQLYEFTKDYPLGGHKKGDKLELSRPPSKKLQQYVQLASDEDEEVPTDKWTKDDIIQWLASKGYTGDTSVTKDELLKAVKKISK